MALYVSISVHSPRDQARVFFKIFYVFLAPGGARKCHTGFFDSKLVDRKKARSILERKACMFILACIPLRIWIIKAESSEVFVHDAPTRPFLSTEQLPFPSFFSVILQDL